ncbi:MAG: GDP-L-fucose synthase, partial [Nanoarchaeota archaeon]|nr:GDP-L-fucose synthase [Nanoarchaeota archaeon]
MTFWENKRVLVTGGAGFLGSFIVERLKKEQVKEENIFIPRSKDYDLRKEDEVDRLFKEFRPNIVIHAAVNGGGIGYAKEHPGSILYNNNMINTLIIEASRKYNVEKFVGVGSVCSYPKFTEVPFKEEDLWKGFPEETNATYGMVKKMMMLQTQSYKEQYGLNGIHLLLVNLYGPRDEFNPNRSHVIPSLIRKFDDAVSKKLDHIEVWGTGTASREFLYVEDAAEGIVLAAEKYNKSDPINLGSGMEISIKNLTEKIANIIGFKGKIIWDSSKPDGQMRRCLDVSKAEKEFGFRAKTSFDLGLKKTVDWYFNNIKTDIKNK